MLPGQRIDIIKRVATRLVAESDWTIIDLVLEQFGFTTLNSWNGDQFSYVVHILKGGDESRLAGIDQYLMGHSRPGDEPWENEGFRLFLTHVDSQKQAAHSLKSCLRYFGIDAFVAHADIQPGKEWQIAIESALHSCDALAGLLHQGFRESDWCDQEVGIALGRGVPVVPIHFDLHPYGFFGTVQALNNAATQLPKTLARNLVLVLLDDKRTSEKLTQAIVDQLSNATSYDQANTLSRILAEKTPLLSREQVEQLRNAEKENSQLQGAYDFERNLSSIEAKIEATRGLYGNYDYDEEPF
ncbi:MAG: toll/interleukin-1 receptor domain-containing protein [Rhodobacteraceae bacterium]|nr:toll/interleukin-1 receptor domain-containing protein [Paracoccaceae bacterium]